MNSGSSSDSSSSDSGSSGSEVSYESDNEDLSGEDTIRPEFRALQDALHALNAVTALVNGEDTILPPFRTLREQSQVRHHPHVTRTELELKVLQSLGEPLAQVQSKLRVRCGRTRNALAPINILPDELLEMTFSYDTRKGIFPDYFDINAFLVDISHVCQRWRRIALRRAALWTHVDLSWDKFRINTWLSRSGNHLLDIIYQPPKAMAPPNGITLAHEREWVTDDGCDVMEGPCFNCSHRWGSVTFYLNDHDQFERLRDALNLLDLSGVHTFNLTGRRTNEYTDASWFRKRMPDLQSLHLDWGFTYSLLEVVPNLCVLKLQDGSGMLSGATWCSMFKSNPYLEVVHAGWGGRGRYPRAGPAAADKQIGPSSEAVIGPQLAELEVVLFDWDVGIGLMHRLQFPMLRSLSITGDEPRDSNGDHSDVVLAEAFSTFFHNLPMLEAMTLRIDWEDFVLLIHTIGISSSDLMLPNLRTLSIPPNISKFPRFWEHLHGFLDDRATKMEGLGITRKPLDRLRLRLYKTSRYSEHKERLSARVHEIDTDFFESVW